MIYLIGEDGSYSVFSVQRQALAIIASLMLHWPWFLFQNEIGTTFYTFLWHSRRKMRYNKDCKQLVTVDDIKSP